MRTPWAALIGHPVEHSFSPLIYRAFSYALNRPLHYRALDIRERKLGPALTSARDRSWLGWNVTLPYKVTVLEYLDELDTSAQDAGAANLISFRQGRSIGFNTDAEGFVAPFRTHGFPIAGKNALVLGAGGAARAVGAALRRERAGETVFLNRTEEKAAALAGLFTGRSGTLDPETLRRELCGADIVINATSLGMDGASNPLPPTVAFKKGAVAYDLVYRPRTTPFLKTAGDSGAETVGGLEMLVAQAGAAWEIWFSEKIPPPVAVHVREELERKLDEDS